MRQGLLLEIVIIMRLEIKMSMSPFPKLIIFSKYNQIVEFYSNTNSIDIKNRVSNCLKQLKHAWGTSLSEWVTKRVQCQAKWCHFLEIDLIIGGPHNSLMNDTWDLRQPYWGIDFSLKCLKHPRNNRLFPLNPATSNHYVRNKEMFKVNFARTEDYRNATIAYCQRLLNDHFNGK